MAKLLSLRNPHLRINACLPCINITRTNILPNAVPIPDKKPSDGDMIRNLRIAITPSYGYGSYSFKTEATSSKCSSGLAGDPRRVGTGQNIRVDADVTLVHGIAGRFSSPKHPMAYHKYLIKGVLVIEGVLIGFFGMPSLIFQSYPSKSHFLNETVTCYSRGIRRAEILDKWNMRPKPDVQKEWLKNIMFN